MTLCELLGYMSRMNESADYVYDSGRIGKASVLLPIFRIAKPDRPSATVSLMKIFDKLSS